MDNIIPYSALAKSHPSEPKAFYLADKTHPNLSFKSNFIPTVCRPIHVQLDREHLPSTSRSDDDHQSLTSSGGQTAQASALEIEKIRARKVIADIKPTTNHAQAKFRRRAAARPFAHDVLAADTPYQNDRFIPKRSDHSIFITRHRIRKDPGDMTVNEKLSRQQECCENPFTRQPFRGVFQPSLHSPRSSLQAPHMSPHLVDDQASPNQYSFSRRRITPRQVSVGGIWNVGGSSIAIRRPWQGTTEGQEDTYEDKAATPLYVARYEYNSHVPELEDSGMSQSRLAIALDIDMIRPQLSICKPNSSSKAELSPSSPHYENYRFPLVWRDCQWKRAELSSFNDKRRQTKSLRESVPFCVLLTPGILDDFYCTVLAYSHTSKVLAYAIMDIVYLWSTKTCRSVAVFPAGHHTSDHVTALSFSSTEGRKSILAIATWHGFLHLWSLAKPQPRRIWQYRLAITCVAFKPTTTRRLSTIVSGTEANVEDLVVGDKTGIIWYYCVESSHLDTLSKVTLLARIEAHCGCICGISWSPDNKYLATSADDDACLLFDLNRILSEHSPQGLPLIEDYLLPGARPPAADSYIETGLQFLHSFRRISRLETGSSRSMRSRSTPNLAIARINRDDEGPQGAVHGIGRNRSEQRPEGRRQRRSSFTGSDISDNFQAARILELQEFLPGLCIGPLNSRDAHTAKRIPYNQQKHRFMHRSAVKAIAFAPWQPTLLATGGGMSDRTVHFYHTPSGSCLARIYVWAQVTGLVWSTTQREIAVILGFSEGDHPFRIAVFAWPSCEQTAAIPWNIDLYGQVYPDYHVSERALAAISIPGFVCPPYERDKDTSSADDECIAIISKDNVRVYRIWSKTRRSAGAPTGILHSSILESVEGIESTGNEIIR